MMNPFPVPSAFEMAQLQELCTVALRCYERGWNAGTAGNFSLVRRDHSLVWMSPSGICKGDLKSAQFIAVDVKSRAPVAPCAAKPSDETPLHLGIYEAHPKARIIVHVHPPNLVKKSLLTKDFLIFSGLEMQKALGAKSHLDVLNIPVIENTQDMQALSKTISKKIKAGIPVIVLRGHGIYCWANEPQTALNYIEALECLCQ